MKYLPVIEIAKLWSMSERTVRNYCAHAKIPGAVLMGKTWLIPEGSTKPLREKKIIETDNALLNALRKEKQAHIRGGLYHKIQIELTYNSNRIEGSRLTEEQTRFIYETNTIGIDQSAVNVDDIIETVNHFRCVDFILDNAKAQLSEKLIKELHFMLKVGTSDSRKDWFNVGGYKKLPNAIGGKETTRPKDVAIVMKKLLEVYNDKKEKTLDDIIEYHYRFEIIHPFQDGNGRIGRLIMFKECLANNIVPFILTDNLKLHYYRGLKEYKNEKGFLLDTILTAQDRFKEYLDYFKIG